MDDISSTRSWQVDSSPSSYSDIKVMKFGIGELHLVSFRFTFKFDDVIISVAFE